MKKIAIATSLMLLTSCGMILTKEQLHQRRKIDYEINKLTNEYQGKVDSLLIEYDKVRKLNQIK